jgi:S-DNA-T family DNA segregation ATPase FtsK/SpoIIIE
LSGGDDRPLVVSPLRLGRVERAEAPRPVQDDGRPTDLQAIVATAIETNDRMQLPRQPSPWLPALPDLLALDDVPPVARSTGDPGATATVGLLDIPARQAQEPFGVDFEADGSLLVFGSSGSGKTSLLRTIAVSLARANAPDRLFLYALDFASRGLGSLESLPHCGAVVGGDDVERVQRVFSTLDRWVAERKRRFAETGATSLAELQRSGVDLPRVVVLLDSYGGFASVFDKIDYGARLESFPQLVSEGRPLGIHFVITADRRGAMPLAMSSTVQAKIVLRMADDDDYAVLGLDGRVAKAATLPAGRGFQNDTLEVQCALVGGDPGGDLQAIAVAAEGAALRARWRSDGVAPRIGTLPSEVDGTALLPLCVALRPIIGIGERELAPVEVALSDGHVLVTGPHRSGKSTALAALALGLRSADADLEMHLLAPRRTPLTALDVWTSVARGSDAIDELCSELRDRVDERGLGEPPIVIVLDDGTELADTMADSSLETIIRKGRDVDVWVVGAAEVSAAHRSYGGWLPELRKERHGLLLQPDTDVDGDLLGVRLAKSARTGIAGRGVLVNRAGVEIVQVATH